MVKLWVQLLVPRIEDGNNFGVGVQDEIIAELARVEEAGFLSLDLMTKYFQTRARIVGKFKKHPHILDYKVRKDSINNDYHSMNNDYHSINNDCHSINNDYHKYEQ